MVDVHATCGGRIEVAAVSHQGPRRGNEDAFLIVLPDGSAWRMADQRLVADTAPCWGGGDWLRVAVLDGMGGHSQGGETAETAAALLLRQPPKDSPEALRDMVMALHADLLARAGGPGVSGCTLVMADIDLSRGILCLIHCGDSPAWLCHHDISRKVSRDHRVAEYAFRDGEISRHEYEASLAVTSNRLCQALGFGSFQAYSRAESNLNPNLRIDVGAAFAPDHADAFRMAVGDGDVLLLASDGILTGAPAAELTAALAAGADLADTVGPIATAPTARDNVTAVMVRFGIDHRG